MFAQLLKVFVASPSDVSLERGRIENAIREINLSLRLASGTAIQLEIVRWETHAFPGFGNEPQAVINDQLGTDYDIFIGVFWSRIGTPTGRYSSGSLEEFNIAYEKWKRDHASVTLMIYFKETPLIPSEVDTAQLADIQRFKAGLPDLGGLYWAFKTTDEFETQIRLHLTRVVQEWRKRLATFSRRVEQFQNAAQGNSEIDDAELGFLDYMELAVEAGAQHESTLSRMTKALDNLGKNMEDRTHEREALISAQDITAIRLVYSKSALDLNKFAAVMSFEIPQLSRAHSDLLGYQVAAATSLLNFGQTGREQVKQVLDELNKYSTVIEGAHSNLRYFRHVLASIPPLIFVFNRAKRRAVEALDEVDSLFSDMVGKNVAVRAEISDLLAKSERDLR